MNGYTSDQVFNGAYGELWVDGDYMAEAEAVKAEVLCDKENVRKAEKR